MFAWNRFWSPAGLESTSLPEGSLVFFSTQTLVKCYIIAFQELSGTPNMAVVFSNEKTGRKGAIFDRAAICVSALCLAQCLLLPVLVVLTPLVSLGVFGEEWFHLALLGVIVPLSVAAFFQGYAIHRDARMLGPGVTGLAIVVSAAILHGIMLGALGAALLTSLGGILLISAHWINLRLRRRACLQPES